MHMKIDMSPQDLLQAYPQSKISSGSMFGAFAPTTPNHQCAQKTTAKNDVMFSHSNGRTRHLRPRRVTFKPTVTVRSIPHFNRYPPCMKKKIWNSSAEIDWNARRNKVEFQAEGWDWRNVVMEDQMHVDVAKGQLVHPCHVSKKQQDVEGSRGQRGMTVFPTRRVQGELILC